MKNTLRIIINAYFKVTNTRCSSTVGSSKLPSRAMVRDKDTTRISVITPITGMNFVSNFNHHSQSVNTLYSADESVVNKVSGVVASVCVLALAFLALGV